MNDIDSGGETIPCILEVGLQNIFEDIAICFDIDVAEK